MLLRSSFENDYTLEFNEKRRLQWREPVNLTNDVYALGQLIDMIQQPSNTSGGGVAFVGVMDIITHAKKPFLTCSLHHGGGIMALRRLLLRADVFSTNWNGIGPGIAIFNRLVNSSIEVRSCLLDYWLLLLRPIKLAFQKFEKIGLRQSRFSESLGYQMCKKELEDERIVAFIEQIRPFIIDDPRVILRNDSGPWVTFSDYLRSLELMFIVAPDGTKDSVDRIYRMNRSVELYYTSFRETQSDKMQPEHETVPGPRLQFTNFLDRFDLGDETPDVVNPDIALKIRWDLQAIRLNQTDIIDNIKHQVRRNRFADINPVDDDELLSTLHSIEPTFSVAIHLGNTDDWMDAQDITIMSMANVPDQLKHNINGDIFDEENETEFIVNVTEKSDTWAIAEPASQRLRRDPRQSKWFRKIVKPLVNSLCLPESQKEAAKIVYAGYETLPRKNRHTYSGQKIS